MATLVTLTLLRPTEKTPWGFRLGGGADYKSPLVVQKVTGDSIASKSLSKGDVIIMLQEEDARGLCHFDACDLVKNSGRQLNMTVRKASSSQYMYQENSSNLQRLEQSLVQGRIQQESERRNRRSNSRPPVNEVTSPKMVESPIYFTPEASLAFSPPNVFSPPIPTSYSPHNNPLSPPVLKLKLNRNNVKPNSPSISETSNLNLTQQPVSSGTVVNTPNRETIQNECFSEYLSSPCNEENYFNPFLNQFAAKNNLENNSNQCYLTEQNSLTINADASTLKNNFRSMERLNSVSSDHNYDRDVSNDPEEIAKRTQLQQLIQEKLRLEEKMMIAKRRQSESKSFGSLMDINYKGNVSTPDDNSNKVNSNKIVKASQSEETISTTLVPTKNLQMKDNKEGPPVLRLRTIKIGPPASMRTSFTDINKCHENEAKQEAKVIPISNCMSEGEQMRLREENRIRDEQIRKMQEHNYDEKRNKNTSKNTPNLASNEAKKKKEMTNFDGKPLADDKSKRNPVNSNQNALVVSKQSPNVTDSNAHEPDNSDAQKLKISKEDKRKKELKLLQEQFKKDQIVIQEEIMKRKCKAEAEQKLKEEAEEKKRAKEEHQKQVILKIIKDEENKLLERKKMLEEKMKREKLEEIKEKEKVALPIKTEKNTKVKHKSSKTIKDSYQVSKMKTYEQQRIAMQKVVQRQHEESARQLNDKLKQQSQYYSDANIYEDVVCSEHKEKELNDLKQLETKKMREEQETYRELLEEKRQSELHEADDFISENGNARSFTESVDHLIEHEEQFEELTATSEEELLEAQEKSIRNLNRQLKQQEEKSKQRSNCSINDQYQSNKSVPVHSHRQYASTGDLRRSDSRTLPVTKFNPDPMEFGFKPIESPILSKSLTNIEADSSIVVNPSGSEIDDGVKAFGSLSNITDFSNRYGEDSLWRSHSMSTSLGNLEQVYSKPPLPFNVKRDRIRHTASEEVLASTQSKSPALDENDRFIPPRRRDSVPCDVSSRDDDNYEQLESYVDFSSLMSEYYSSYYEAYYQNYYL